MMILLVRYCYIITFYFSAILVFWDGVKFKSSRHLQAYFLISFLASVNIDFDLKWFKPSTSYFVYDLLLIPYLLFFKWPQKSIYLILHVLMILLFTWIIDRFITEALIHPWLFGGFLIVLIIDFVLTKIHTNTMQMNIEYLFIMIGLCFNLFFIVATKYNIKKSDYLTSNILDYFMYNALLVLFYMLIIVKNNRILKNVF